jgi:hypothetical protein
MTEWDTPGTLSLRTKALVYGKEGKATLVLQNATLAISFPIPLLGISYKEPFFGSFVKN